MYYCDACKIKVRTNNVKCPLCQGSLSGEKNELIEPFPNVQKLKNWINPIIMKIFTFVILVTIVISNFVNYLVTPHFWWAGYVTAGGALMWLVVMVALVKRRNVFKSLLWEFVILNGALVAYDLIKGFMGWSIDFFLPISLTSVIAAMLLNIILQKLDSPDYMIYLLMTGVIGLVPGILVFTGIVGIKLPSVICTTSSLVLILALVVFQHKAVVNEVSKKFHI